MLCAWILFYLCLVADVFVSGQDVLNSREYLPPSDIKPEGDTARRVILKPKQEDEEEDHAHWDIRKSIPGEPGQDYPVYDTIPSTSFTCKEKPEGYYADIEAGCQVFHICTRMPDVSKSFLCPNGSIFNQELSICDWWTQVDCKESENFQRIDSVKANKNKIEVQRPNVFPTFENTQDGGAPDIDIRFGGSESFKLEADLLPPYNVLENTNALATERNNYKSTLRPFVEKKPKLNLSFPVIQQQNQNVFDNRLNEKPSPKQGEATVNMPSRSYINSVLSSTDRSIAESKQTQRSDFPVSIQKYLPPEIVPENSELKENTYLPPENVPENSELKGNIYLPPKIVPESTELRGNTYLPPDIVSENSELKGNTYLPPDIVPENSELKGNTYLPPDIVPENSEPKGNTYLPPDIVPDNSELTGNTYLPPENVATNSNIKENMYLPPKNILVSSEESTITINPTITQSNFRAQTSSGILPENNPQESAKLLQQFSSIYDSDRNHKLNKDSTKLSNPSYNFPSTLSHLLTINPTTQTNLPDLLPSNKPLFTSASSASTSTTSQSYFTPQAFKLINIQPIKEKPTRYYQSTLSPYSFQTGDFTDGFNHVTPSSSLIVDTSHKSSETTTESYATTINLINDLATPKANTPYDSKNYSESSSTAYSGISSTTEVNTENDKVQTGVKFSLFSTPRPFDSNENIASSYLPPNLQHSSPLSVTEKVDLKPFEILNINNLQPSSTKSRSEEPEVVQSIAFNLDSEDGRKEFDLALSSGLFSDS